MKSLIRIELRKPQSIRHVCPTSARVVSFNYEAALAPQIVFSRTRVWAERLLADAIRDGSGDEIVQAPHHVSFELIVTGRDGSEYRHACCATLLCHQVCLLTRYLSRFDSQVATRKRQLQAKELWDLIPYSFYAFSEGK